MNEKNDKTIKKLYGELISMEGEIEGLKHILVTKKGLSPTVEKMYEDLQATHKSISNIKKSIDKADDKKE